MKSKCYLNRCDGKQKKNAQYQRKFRASQKSRGLKQIHLYLSEKLNDEITLLSLKEGKSKKRLMLDILQMGISNE